MPNSVNSAQLPAIAFSKPVFFSFGRQMPSIRTVAYQQDYISHKERTKKTDAIESLVFQGRDCLAWLGTAKEHAQTTWHSLHGPYLGH